MPGSELQTNTRAISRLLILIAGIILVASSWFWWHNVQMSANNVFWGMIDNNLSTSGVTRHIVQSTTDKSLDQYIREQFGALNASESLITLKQTDSSGQSSVQTDTIGTVDNDYSKYISISTPEKSAKGQPIETSNVVGIWGKSADTQQGQKSVAKYFQQSILTIIPFGNFNQEQRQNLIDQMHSHNIYDFSVANAKSQKMNGRAVFVYQVDIAPASYVQLMQQYVKYLGLGDIGLDPSTYAGSPALKAEITVDKLSRQLVKISYPGSGQSETLVDQNLDQPIVLPTKTIPISELQAKIQKIVQ
ncbi:MAG: hypothetical protein ACXWLH_05585 [Candidatus Saccharimonadales bacterium]